MQTEQPLLRYLLHSSALGTQAIEAGTQNAEEHKNGCLLLGSSEGGLWMEFEMVPENDLCGRMARGHVGEWLHPEYQQGGQTATALEIVPVKEFGN